MDNLSSFAEILSLEICDTEALEFLTAPNYMFSKFSFGVTFIL